MVVKATSYLLHEALPGALPAGEEGQEAASCLSSADLQLLDLLNPDLPNLEDSPLLPLVASVLEALVEINEHKELVAAQAAGPDMHLPRLTVFHGLRPPPITVEAYLLRIAKYAKCSPACFAAALMYMRRLAALDSALAPTSLNVHRLVLTGVMLAAKVLDDRYYNNAFYAKVGGISTPELNRLELEMLKLLQFRLDTSPETVVALLGQLHSGSFLLEAYGSGGLYGGSGSVRAGGAVPAVGVAQQGCVQVMLDGGGAQGKLGVWAVGGGEVGVGGGDVGACGRKRRSTGAEGVDADAMRRFQRRSMEQMEQ